MKKLIGIISSSFTGIIVVVALAWAAAPGVINSYVGVCSPNFPTRCILPNADGSVNISGAGSGGTSSDFAAAFPTAGTAAGFSDGTNMQGAKVTDLDSGGGTDYGVEVSWRIAASGGSIPITAGAGSVAAGTPRFTLASDDPAVVGIALTNTDIGALGSSACATDTGSCNVNAKLSRIAERLTTLISSLGGTGTIGSDFPASATANGIAAGAGSVTGTPDLKQLIGCDSSVAISTASSGNTQLVALTSGMTIYVCGYMMVGAGAVDAQIIYGTGSACATGETDLTGAMSIAAAGGGMGDSSPFWRGLKTAASNALCIELSAAVQVSGILYYTQF